MAFSGVNVDLKLPGTAVSFTTEPMTSLGGNVWQITNAAKRVFAPFASITVSTGTILTIDRLFGTVQFTGSVTTPTVTGQYLPMTSVASARGFTRSIRSANIDTTTLIRGAASTAFVEKLPVMLDCSATVDRIQNWDEYFQDELVDNAQLVLQFFNQYDDAASDCAMWARIVDITNSSSYDSVVAEQISFEGTADNEGRSFSYGP